MTINELLAHARSLLNGPEAMLEAEILMEAICGISRSRQFSQAADIMTEAQVELFMSALQRRRSGVPLAYITGSRGFWDMELKVSPDVLIPRQDTEILVEQSLVRIPRDAAWQIADLGTGSGAIALAIARERPQCKLIATDYSMAALEIAKENATLLRVDNIKFVSGSWCLPLKTHHFDMIVSNPPYIRADDPHLLEGDLPAEPRNALASGNDGLDAIRQIIKESITILKNGGWLLLEHGYDQSRAVTDILQHADYKEIFTEKDYGGNDRVTAGRRQVKDSRLKGKVAD